MNWENALAVLNDWTTKAHFNETSYVDMDERDVVEAIVAAAIGGYVLYRKMTYEEDEEHRFQRVPFIQVWPEPANE